MSHMTRGLIKEGLGQGGHAQTTWEVGRMPRGSQHSTDQKLEVAGKDPAPRGPHLTLDPWILPCDTRSRRAGPPGFYSFAAAASGN